MAGERPMRGDIYNTLFNTLNNKDSYIIKG